MIFYHYQAEQLGDYYRSYSKQFPHLHGFGTTAEDATSELLGKINQELNRIIKNGERFPRPFNWQETEKGDQATLMSMATQLKMYLHLAMLEMYVTRAELAKFLALTLDEVSTMGFTVENLRKLTPKALPKHKKVQRLLDVTHQSTLQEIEEAFQVLDYSVDFGIKSKFKPDADPVLKI